MIFAGNARSLIANRGDLIRDMRAAGLSVAAAVPTVDYLPEVKELGITIYPVEMGRTGINPLHDLKYLLALRTLLRRVRPRAVFGYTIKPVVYGSLAARLAGVPRIYSMITGLGHVFTTENARNRRLQKIIGVLYRLGIACNRKVFFQNPDDLQEFMDRGMLKDQGKAVRTYGSGVDMQRFAREPLPKEATIFLFIGRLLTEKGIAEFCEAARQVQADYPDAHFIAVGPHDANLPHSCAAEDLERWKAEGVVEFVGGVSDVRPWIKECSVFVLPSYREGTPRSVLEAMSMGRAIITSDAPGCRETVEEGVNGFLVPPRTSQPLAEAMRRFLEEPEHIAAMGEASWQLAERHYDVHKVNRVILDAMELTTWRTWPNASSISSPAPRR
ncbi:glycosyltransferase family 4 protein [Halomonas campisalis]|uniref:Glycosyltransferase family 4 protein n=1 Tax=Billgrantia campisalis TaxID=74661 RepID=A0ABS9P3G8_9GAMM|nr:glycosyltransferase family 4 protein [Halomonas campisalis]MCG6656331.1 glycosyltransferase family 4 protein [Halomonas campisalis]MDR5861517.1 glycosyltransferase family 4 protein [Halomonas campisalis]